MLDHDASHRLGQRPTSSPINILRVATDDDRPTNAHHGQVAYVDDSQKSWIWDSTAVVADSEELGEWQPFGGGIEFYAQGEPPTTAGYAAFWLDTTP